MWKPGTQGLKQMEVWARRREPFLFHQLSVIYSFLKESLRDDFKEEGEIVGPGNTESEAVWSEGGELLRMRTEALFPFQV